MPDQRDSPQRFRRRGIVPGTVAALLALWFLWPALKPTDVPPPRPWPQLIDGIQRGRPEALARARAAALAEWDTHRSRILDMLVHDHWRVRSGGCRILAQRNDPSLLPWLVPRASDHDWRVRDAAFGALDAVRPLPTAAPMRNTPLDDRERVLLAWLDAHDAAAQTPLGPELCEVYANQPHLQFGRPLADRCLRCHAGAEPTPLGSNSRCAHCHGEVHAQWLRSAHARSLSHLALATVIPETGKVEWMTFDPVQGIGCLECHRVASPPEVPATLASRPTRCPVRFRGDAPAADACARCHASVDRQWRQWQQGPQPRKEAWPTGHVNMAYRGDTRRCVDCHMPRTGEPGIRPHHWAARQSTPLLAQAVAVTITPLAREGDRRVIRLTLTNLTGHAFPTGSRRRAVKLFAGPETQQPLPEVVGLSPVRPGRRDTGLEPALGPGERRHYDIHVPFHTAHVAYRLLYYRNVEDPNAYTIAFLAGRRFLLTGLGP